jgi:Rha family phage regulatory protein
MKRVFINHQPGRPHSMAAGYHASGWRLYDKIDHTQSEFSSTVHGWKLSEAVNIKQTKPKTKKERTMNESTTEVKDLVVLNAKNEAVTTSLKVAAKFGKQHKHVLEAIEALDCSADFRRSNFRQATYSYTVNRFGATAEAPCYHMTRQGFTFLAMGFTGPKAAEFKEAYIAAFDKMEAELQKCAQVPAFDPSSLTRLDILIMAVDSEKRALAAEDRVQKLETVTKKMLPKAKFFDAVSNARGNVNLTVAAKILGRGPRKMMELLRSLGILYYSRGGHNVPAQRHITAGHFVVKNLQHPAHPGASPAERNPESPLSDHPGGGIPPPYPPPRSDALAYHYLFRTQIFFGKSRVHVRSALYPKQAYPMDDGYRRPQSKVLPQWSYPRETFKVSRGATAQSGPSKGVPGMGGPG